MSVCRQILEFASFKGRDPISYQKVFEWFVLFVSENGRIRRDSCDMLLARLVSRKAILFHRWFKPAVLCFSVWGLVASRI